MDPIIKQIPTNFRISAPVVPKRPSLLAVYITLLANAIYHQTSVGQCIGSSSQLQKSWHAHLDFLHKEITCGLNVPFRVHVSLLLAACISDNGTFSSVFHHQKNLKESEEFDDES